MTVSASLDYDIRWRYRGLSRWDSDLNCIRPITVFYSSFSTILIPIVLTTSPVRQHVIKRQTRSSLKPWMLRLEELRRFSAKTSSPTWSSRLVRATLSSRRCLNGTIIEFPSVAVAQCRDGRSLLESLGNFGKEEEANCYRQVLIKIEKATNTQRIETRWNQACLKPTQQALGKWLLNLSKAYRKN